jgi:tRNA(fMet)-specific endonuclease VapC
MALTIADSDVLIDFLRGQGKGATRVASDLEARTLATTAVSAFEIYSGVRSSKQHKAVDALLDAMAILPFGSVEARLAAELRHELDGQGRTTGMADIMIASICIVNGCKLLTRNLKHFERMANLELAQF